MIDEPVPTMPLMVPATRPTARTKRKLKSHAPPSVQSAAQQRAEISNLMSRLQPSLGPRHLIVSVKRSADRLHRPVLRHNAGVKQELGGNAMTKWLIACASMLLLT